MTDKMRSANESAVNSVIEAEPCWVGVDSAENVLKDFDENTILHSGPPIEYVEMCELHKNAMKNAVIFEGWAKNHADAEALIVSGDVKIDSAMNYNTVGSGVGVVTRSVPLLICEDKKSGSRAGVFPHEGKFGGGFCGWGLYSEDIKKNLEYMKSTLFKDICGILDEVGGFPLKNVISQSLCMGDENHSSQNASDALFIRNILPYALRCKNSSELLSYFAETSRFFHNFGQCASKCAIMNAENAEFSSMVVAAGGNGVEYGIKVAGLGDKWYTAPSPMIKGRFMVDGIDKSEQLPWIGDSSIVECAGLGGIASAAAPTVCSWRNQTLSDGIKITRDMEKISLAKNKYYPIPNMDFDALPVGIDIFKVLDEGILPVINGGMISNNGGWMGAGCANIPIECFQKAAEDYKEVYGYDE